MTWNYRICRHTENGADVWAIREVYYSALTGDITSYTDPVRPFGETQGELTRDLAHMVAGLSQTPLDIDTLKDDK